MSKAQELAWKKEGEDWVLRFGKRNMGRVVPDKRYPNMWRPALSEGCVGDMANLSWACSVTLDAATRELEWEPSRRPHFTAENEGA
jgi:hypothetical protein